MQERCRPRGFVTSFQFCPDRGSTSLSKSRDSPVLSWLVLYPTSPFRMVFFGPERYIPVFAPSRSQVQVRAHIFLQSVNVIRNMDYLARCIKTEAHLLHRDVESISVAQGLAFSKSMCFKKSHKVEKQIHPHT